jgi:hypothetical protein
LEATESAQLDGDGAGEVVDAEVELGEAREGAELARYLPAQGVVVQVEAGEGREHGERGRDGASEPLPLERDGGDPAAGVAGDALEVVAAAAGVAATRPRGQSAPRRVQRRLQLHQRVQLGVARGRGGGGGGGGGAEEQEREREEGAPGPGRHGAGARRGTGGTWEGGWSEFLAVPCVGRGVWGFGGL